jgi:amino-acid N-acetyltransferase
MASETAAIPGFSEKDFYLAEFRGRAVAIALEGADEAGLKALGVVLDQFSANGTRVLVLTEDPELLERIVPNAWVSSQQFLWPSVLWRLFRVNFPAGLRVDAAGNGFVHACHQVVDRLQLAKLVLIEPYEALVDSDGSRLSYVDLAELDRMLEAPHSMLTEDRLLMLREIRSMLAAGLPATNLCSLAGLAEELFTYAGSGTLFTRERYTVVRSLSLDDFDAAHYLIGRGVSEGYLVARSEVQVDSILAHAFGVFVEDRYLAGIGALIPHSQTSGVKAGEVASLYTVTRFLGEGVGAHLLQFARDSAERAGMAYLFACTTSDRVEAFFLRHGYRTAARDEIPDAKWDGYPDDRRADVRCLRLELS